MLVFIKIEIFFYTRFNFILTLDKYLKPTKAKHTLNKSLVLGDNNLVDICNY